MAVYKMLTTLTDEGRKTLKDKPARIKEVNKEVEAMGGKILAKWRCPDGGLYNAHYFNR